MCVWGGGGGTVHFRSDIRKVGGGGGGSIRFRSDTFVWHTENTLALIINGYNFDRRGVLKHPEHPPWIRHWIINYTYMYMYLSTYYLGILHTRARMNLIVVFNCIHSLIVFILETEGGARAP